MQTSSPLDSQLLDTLYAILREGKGAERRSRDRRSYRCVQMIAPYDGNRLPVAEEFVHIQCHDISQGGFAFLSTEPPAFDHLVLALGRVPFTFVIAHVLHFVPVEEAGETYYLVGCRFLQRIDAD